MTYNPHPLIEALRSELKEYGEMLALLDEQQEAVIVRQPGTVLENVRRVNAQADVLHHLRIARDRAAHDAARATGAPADGGLQAVVNALSPEFRPMLRALIDENNQLLSRVQARVRQNHLLLSRSMELMSRLIQSLTPSAPVSVYRQDGCMHTAPGVHALYEAVG